LVIHSFQDLSRSFSDICLILKPGFGIHHKKSSRYAFSRHIGNHQNDVVLIQKEEIVKISAYFLGRIHRSVKIKFSASGKSRKCGRQHFSLNTICHTELRGYFFFFSSNVLNLFDIIINGNNHVGNIRGQSSQFVSDLILERSFRTFLLSFSSL